MDSHEEYQEILRQLPMTCGQPDLHRAYIEAGSICSICESIEVIKIEKLNEDRFANKVARRVVELMKVEIMSTKTDGGAAFPVADHPSLSVDPGMTLRDYFAAKAMQGLIAGCTDKLVVGPGIPNDNKRISIVAFSMADAMLAARENKS